MIRTICASLFATVLCSSASGCCCCLPRGLPFFAVNPPVVNPPVINPPVVNIPPPVVNIPPPNIPAPQDNNNPFKDNVFKDNDNPFKDKNPFKDLAKDNPFKDNPFKDLAKDIPVKGGVPALKEFVYIQTTGKLMLGDQVFGTGYSGKGAGKNNAAMQNVLNTGPIPTGEYTIGLRKNDKKGEPMMTLLPLGHNASGRFPGQSFAISADSDPPGNTNGNIVMPRDVREKIATSGVVRLKVVQRE
jgi:hypothetical protein